MNFPPALNSYNDSTVNSLFQVLIQRASIEPINLVATIIFFCAIIHTFIAPKFLKLAKKHDPRSSKAVILHYFGEIEAVFGIWLIPLFLLLWFAKGWGTITEYVEHGVSFNEPVFVVVIMSIAATRPVMLFAEKMIEKLAKLGRGTPAAWWFAILTVGPLLGSLITEPASMTISALLLARFFYNLKPGKWLSYATVGALFVNISVGGTLTHFAAPPVLMVASRWGWNSFDLFINFGWKATLAIVITNLVLLTIFKAEFKTLKLVSQSHTADTKKHHIPAWIIMIHLIFLVWTVTNAHHPNLLVFGFLFFIAFLEATTQYQDRLILRGPLLVGLFLAGLVLHGGLQGWWIEPLLLRLQDLELFSAAVLLTAFNDNAAITYLATLVPNLSEEMKYAVVAGAVSGGGLTIIANAPNPAGNAILSKFFPGGIAPLKLFLGALLPTIINCILFQLIR